MAKTVSDVLNAAADLIEGDGRWCRGYSARKPNPEKPSEQTAAAGGDPAAVCWGAGGAIFSSRVTTSRSAALAAFRRFQAHVGGNVYLFNADPRLTQEDAVAKLREAARSAEAA